MRELTEDELFLVSGSRMISIGSDQLGGYGDFNNAEKSLGLPKSDLTNTPGWGAAIGAIAGTRIGGTKGGEIGFTVGHAVENFDWKWYREYRKVADIYEQKYSGGLH